LLRRAPLIVEPHHRPARQLQAALFMLGAVSKITSDEGAVNRKRSRFC
jgi:hypothetical protein